MKTETNVPKICEAGAETLIADQTKLFCIVLMD